MTIRQLRKQLKPNPLEIQRFFQNKKGERTEIIPFEVWGYKTKEVTIYKDINDPTKANYGEA